MFFPGRHAAECLDQRHPNAGIANRNDRPVDRSAILQQNAVYISAWFEVLRSRAIIRSQCTLAITSSQEPD
jgi:hypothetical protein